MPVVGESERETCVIAGLNGDDVTGEFRSEEEADGSDLVGHLGFFTGQVQHRELLVRTEHDEFGPEDDASLLRLVIVDLYTGVVRDAVGHDFGFISWRLTARSWLLVGESWVLDE